MFEQKVIYVTRKPVSRKMRGEILSLHKRICFYCKCKLTIDNITYDHKTPVSRGGEHTLENIVPACVDCNSKKYNRTAEEFVERYAEYLQQRQA